MENDEGESHIDSGHASAKADLSDPSSSDPSSSAYKEFNASSANGIETKSTTDDTNLVQETKSSADVKEVTEMNMFTRLLSLRVTRTYSLMRHPLLRLNSRGFLWRFILSLLLL